MRRKIVLVCLVVALVISGLVMVSTEIANAGSNGQQIRVKVGCQYAPAIETVTISGYMWNEQYTTKSWSFSSTRDITFWGWWWKTVGGTNVRIAYRYTGKNPETGYPYQTYAVMVYVPKSYPSDVYLVDVTAGQTCKPH